MSIDGDRPAPGPHRGEGPQGEGPRSAASGPGAPVTTPSPVTRFFGGSPSAVLLRLMLLSIVVGVIFAVFGFDPRDLVDRKSVV